MMTRLIPLILLCLMTGTAMAQPPKVTELMSKDLPESPGKELLMITVEHAPGRSSPVHRHNAQAMVYVLEGSVVQQVKGGKEVTLTPGQTFYEGPDDVHVRSSSATSSPSAPPHELAGAASYLVGRSAGFAHRRGRTAPQLTRGSRARSRFLTELV